MIHSYLVCVRAIIPMGESTNASNSQDLLSYTDTCGFKCAWMFMMIYDESLRIWICFGFTLFFFLVLLNSFFYMLFFLINLTFGLSLMGYELPGSCPPFFKIHLSSVAGKVQSHLTNLPTSSNSGATLWPALVFHLLGIDGRGIGISGF